MSSVNPYNSHFMSPPPSSPAAHALGPRPRPRLPGRTLASDAPPGASLRPHTAPTGVRSCAPCYLVLLIVICHRCFECCCFSCCHSLVISPAAADAPATHGPRPPRGDHRYWRRLLAWLRPWPCIQVALRGPQRRRRPLGPRGDGAQPERQSRRARDGPGARGRGRGLAALTTLPV